MRAVISRWFVCVLEGMMVAVPGEAEGRDKSVRLAVLITQNVSNSVTVIQHFL